MQTITPCLWFNNNVEEAIDFYKSSFKNVTVGRTARYDAASSKASGMPEGSILTIEFEIEGLAMTALNGGPMFKFTPAISFFVNCATAEEVETLYKKLSDGGEVMMELGEYPFSKKYAFFKDKFGVSWQVMVGTSSNPGQKIVPALLFVNEKYGKAEEAINFYTSLFPESKTIFMSKAKAGGPEPEGAIQFATFSLLGGTFAAMEGMGEHKFDFTPATSFIVDCDTQEEIDTYWNALSTVKEAEQCGWLVDKYGVSWQIVPKVLTKMLTDADAAKAGRAMKAMLEMKKLNIADLEAAFNG